MYAFGGTVTERHLLYALSLKIIDSVGRENVLAFLKEKLGITPSEKIQARLNDTQSEHFTYDLLGVMKSELNERVYIPADEEMLTLKQAVAFAGEIGATLCYAYLGDIGDSCEKLLRFYHYMEALVAFHRFYFGEKKDRN